MILVCPGRHAVLLAAERRPSRIVTLASPDAGIPALSGAPRLVLRFHDIVAPREGLSPPDSEQVGSLLAFAADWSPVEGPLLIHCFAGVSRSTAAAYAVACARSEPGDEARLAAALRAASPSATPNPLLVALADAALDRQGRMSAAIDALGRGAECFEGETFTLPVAAPQF